MRLKRLRVRGFKSFADKTDFAFDHDLTGIVGPNGCGKSNVVDALKWVLGDQRAKSLRGAEMTDVIFKGAEGREPLPFAEVTVFLEDPEGRFDGRTEVSIGRRLTRDKESHYLLNGESVRLKDVRDVLMDTGLGVGAYSVMEQGRIDAVLSANPESRRAIFEEAAGISRFKLQKKESLRKLERTEQNLARVKDLLEERGRRIRSLKIQAGKARRFRELRGRLRDLRSAIAVRDAQALREQERIEAERLEALEQSLREGEARHEALQEQLAAEERAIETAEGSLEAAQETLRAAQSRRDGLESKAEALRQRAEELSDDAEAAGQRSAAVRGQHEDRRRLLGEGRTRLTELEEELVALHRELEEKRVATRDSQAAVKQRQVERERARDQVLEHIHERTRVKNLAHDQEAQLRGLGARAQRLQERSGTLTVERERKVAERAAHSLALDALGERVALLVREEERQLGLLEQADREAADLSRLEGGLRERLASVSSRLEVLQGMEAHHEGVDQGPRYLLEHQPEGLVGRLLDRLEVDLEHGQALEAALGPYLQALVVDTRAHAEAMLRQLSEAQAGRALLLVEEEFHSHFAGEPQLPLPEGARFLTGVLRCAEATRPLLHWLLRGVVLVETLTDARSDRHDLCFVTASGELLCGPRLEGGAAGAETGLVVRKAQIQALGVEQEDLQRQLADLAGDRDRVAGRVGGLKEELRTLGEQLQELRDGEIAGRSELARLADRVGALDEELQEAALEREELRGLRMRALAALGDHLLQEHLVRRQERRAATAEQEVQAALEQSRATAEEAARTEQDLRVRQASCATDRDAQQHKIESHEQMLLELEKAAEELDARGQDARDGVSRAREEAADCAQRLESIQGELEAFGATRDEAAGALATLRERKQEAQDALRASEQQREQAREQLSQERMQQAELGHRFQRIEERLLEDCHVELRRLLGEVEGFGITDRRPIGPMAAPGTVLLLEGPPVPERLLEAEVGLQRIWNDPELDLAESRKEAQVIQSQVDRLGSVNLDAVEELAQEEEKFGGLEQDVEDLSEARRALMEALRKIEAESRAKFGETFEKARENFREIFRKLFQGGRADMFLTESEDELEAGIDIVAKPPGKELQSIALLSGGERSLTALAILFAVFKVKPSPFCILDEVDAALDETNVERFLRVLRDFVGGSQFCIVTHHKRTMAECSILYGITMQKRGVSTRIAVALDEVDGFAEEAKRVQATSQRIAGEESIGF